MNINLNENVTVKLTEFGAHVYNNWICQFTSAPQLMKAGQEITLPIWECFQIWGKELMLGMSQIPFQNNELFYIVPNDAEEFQGLLAREKDLEQHIDSLYNILSTFMKPCPFCGKRVDFDDHDVLYPSGTYWMWDEDLMMRTYHSHPNTPKGANKCFTLHCPIPSGGCGAEMPGDTIEEIITAWNRREN